MRLVVVNSLLIEEIPFRLLAFLLFSFAIFSSCKFHKKSRKTIAALGIKLNKQNAKLLSDLSDYQSSDNDMRRFF